MIHELLKNKLLFIFKIQIAYTKRLILHYVSDTWESVHYWKCTHAASVVAALNTGILSNSVDYVGYTVTFFPLKTDANL